MRGGAPVTSLQRPLGIDNLFHINEKILFTVLYARYNINECYWTFKVVKYKYMIYIQAFSIS